MKAIQLMLVLVLAWGIVFSLVKENEPKEFYCDNWKLSGNSKVWLKDDARIVLADSGRLKAFQLKDCR